MPQSHNSHNLRRLVTNLDLAFDESLPDGDFLLPPKHPVPPSTQFTATLDRAYKHYIIMYTGSSFYA